MMIQPAVRRPGFSEGRRHRCVGRASNPVGGAMRRWVGSTPIPLRRFAFIGLLRGRISALHAQALASAWVFARQKTIRRDGPLSGLSSPYLSTAARFEPICARSRRRLNAKPSTLDSSC